MQVIGLTGGIATGKSTVTRFLVEQGADRIDADEIAHEILRHGQPGYGPVLREFGVEILGADGEIDRAALGRIVFSDESRRELLNRITHPLIGRRIMESIQKMASDGSRRVVLEAALLIENRGADAFRPLVVVSTDPETQLSRLMARDALDRPDALARIRSQMPVSEKAKRADFVIDNSGSLESTYAQTVDVWRKIQSAAVV